MIFIADYGAGNLHSVRKAFEYIGEKAVVSSDASRLPDFEKVLVPGVGAFGHAIRSFHTSGFSDALREHVDKGRPVLGICLGMQLFLTESEERGSHKGLDFVPGKVLRFRSESEKIPQIGWNSVTCCKKSVLFEGVPDKSYFYFVHSYYCAPEQEEDIAATTMFGGMSFCSAIEKNGIFALQFHPEKSSEAGLKVLENFAKY